MLNHKWYQRDRRIILLIPSGGSTREIDIAGLSVKIQAEVQTNKINNYTFVDVNKCQ